MDLLQLLIDGGFIMYPLIICSILVWAVVIEKLWFLSQFRRQFTCLHDRAVVLIDEKKINEAKGLGHTVHHYISAPYSILFEDRTNKNQWEHKMGRRLIETQQGLKRSLWLLGTIGAASPFIGLFGTVVGIIKSFEAIAVSGKSGFSVVAAGLSEALIATAAGIIVAVISVMFFNYFQNRLTILNTEFKHRLEDLMDLFE
ncbi:MAG: MotA/TolQ/ExbB proton channel family protein [Bacteriovoracaceae bacterium]|nr:MotA/TolQ/ExbB proton channel family protein [Bacteriovoracaceae bacterium]